jgi:flagellar motor component MotA
MKRLAGVFLDSSPDLTGITEELIGYVTKARKNGLVSLELELETIADPFLRKALNLAVDGTDLQEIRKMLELEIDVEEQTGEAEAKVFESAGGYAPTIGIIGAVLGLIQVMKNLANIDEVGHGIAVSFVATVYGVGSANLIFLPMAQKIKARQSAESQRKELILEGVSGMVEGLNPTLIREKLRPSRAGAPRQSSPLQRRSPSPPIPRRRLSKRKWRVRRGAQEEAAGAGEPRTVVDLLCRFHHLAVRLLRGDVRVVADRQGQGAAGLRLGETGLGRGKNVHRDRLYSRRHSER